MLAGHFLNLFRLPRSYLSSHQLCSRSLPNLFKAYSSTHCFWVSLFTSTPCLVCHHHLPNLSQPWHGSQQSHALCDRVIFIAVR